MVTVVKPIAVRSAGTPSTRASKVAAPTLIRTRHGLVVAPGAVDEREGRLSASCTSKLAINARNRVVRSVSGLGCPVCSQAIAPSKTAAANNPRSTPCTMTPEPKAVCRA